MRIALLAQTDYPWRSGGVNQALHNLVVYLASRGHEVTVVTMENFAGVSRPMNAVPEAVCIVALPMPLLRLRDTPVLGGVSTLASVLHFPSRAVATLDAAEKPDVVVADFTCAEAAEAWGRRHAVPVAVLRWAHWAEEVSRTSRVFGLLRGHWHRREQRVLSAARCVVVDGPDLVDDALAAGVPHARVCLVPGSVDVARFAAASPDPSLLRAHGVEGRIVLFPSMLRDIKGFDHLLRAFARLPESVRRDATVVATGRGDLDEARRLAEGLGIGDRVVLLGEVPSDELPSWFAASSVAVFPYLFGAGYSVAGIEALAAGLPLVAYDVQAFRAVVEDGRNGLLVTLGDVDGLAAALQRLLDDEPLRARMGENARMDAQRFDTERVGALFEDVLRRLQAGETPCA
jgi:glycosyltransferase involved in cell wall biosynthesis